jgi:hypothetical protein
MFNALSTPAFLAVCLISELLILITQLSLHLTGSAYRYVLV